MALFKFPKLNTKKVKVKPEKEPVKVDAPQPTKANDALTQKPEYSDPVTAVTEHNNDLLDVIAPRLIEVDFDQMQVNDVFHRSLFVSSYPRFVSPGWLEQVINFSASQDISFFIYPIEGKGVLDDLLHKIAEMEAEISTDIERGKIVNPSTTAKLEDARLLQDELVKGAEHFFEFAFYLTVRALDLEQLNHTTKQVEATLGFATDRGQARNSRYGQRLFGDSTIRLG
jgi:hypothetical protein